MKDLITIEIRYNMKMAGYTEEETDRLCKTGTARFLYNMAEAYAKEHLRKKLQESLANIKELLIAVQDEKERTSAEKNNKKGPCD